MYKKNSDSNLFNPPIYTWVIPLTIFVSTCLFAGIFFLTTFCPNFLLDSNPKYFNLCEYIQTEFVHSHIYKKMVIGYFYWTLNSISTFFNILFGFSFVKSWLLTITYKPWMKKYMCEVSKIITGCDPTQFNDRVAMLIASCNDLTENTILQISKQTYKNVDCWLIDDTYKPKEIERVKTFLNTNPQIKYFKRDEQNRKAHPSKMGNIMAWVAAHGNEYDYILEAETSSLMTNTFAENALCFFHSQLLKNKNLGAIVPMGSFLYSNTILSWINSYSKQFNIDGLGSGCVHGMGGEDMGIKGFGSMYSVKAIKTINWVKAESSTCDTGRGREMLRNGFTIMFDPFDFTSKVGVRDMDGYRKQNIKWNEGRFHNLRNKINWGPCVKNKPFYMKWCAFFGAWSTIIFLIAFVMNIITTSYNLVAKLNYQNFTATFFIGVLWGIVWTCFILIALINGLPISLMAGQFLLPLVDSGIYYFKLYDTVFTSLLFKKWSSKNVTKKSNTNYSFVKKIKLCWKDALWIIFFTILCFMLQYAVHLPPYMIWSRFYVSIIWPSVCFIFWMLIGEIRIKKGWNVNTKEWPDFYKVFKLNYKFVKDHPLWKNNTPKINKFLFFLRIKTSIYL